jgi:hypothetical protein
MQKGLPSINVTVDQLRKQVARGAVGPTQGNASPSPAGMTPAAPAMGGATAGVKANPARGGMPPVSAGQPAMGSAQPPHMHSLTLASTTHLAKIGHPHPRHAALQSMARAGLAAAKKPAAPKAGRGFGALGGAGGVGPQGGPVSIPGASPGGQGGSPVPGMPPEIV